ncbi:MAG: hypothetical protein P8N30_09335 [Tateyamaria sp.]|nr:hypothetical protein [Tateyamaria sp.]MDG2057055.1 hypothetical protein [Tateyamaria sp.]
MLDDTHNVDLTAQDLELIEAALHTHEKILSVQSRGGAARARLNALKGLTGRLRRQTPPWPEGPGQSWGHRVRALFSAGGSLRF